MALSPILAVSILITMSMLETKADELSEKSFDFYLKRNKEQVSVFWKGGPLPKVGAFNSLTQNEEFVSSSISKYQVTFSLCPPTHSNPKNIDKANCKNLGATSSPPSDPQTAIFTFSTPNEVEVVGQDMWTYGSGKLAIGIIMVEKPGEPKKEIDFTINVVHTPKGIVLSSSAEINEMLVFAKVHWLTDKNRRIQRKIFQDFAFIPKTSKDPFSFDLSPVKEKLIEWGANPENSDLIKVQTVFGFSSSAFIYRDKDNCFAVSQGHALKIRFKIPLNEYPFYADSNTIEDFFIVFHINTQDDDSYRKIRMEKFHSHVDFTYGYNFVFQNSSDDKRSIIKLDARHFRKGVETHKELLDLRNPDDYVVFGYQIKGRPDELEFIEIISSSKKCGIQNFQKETKITKMNTIEESNENDCRINFVFKDRFSFVKSGITNYKNKIISNEDSFFDPTRINLFIFSDDPGSELIDSGIIVQHYVSKIVFDAETSKSII